MARKNGGAKASERSQAAIDYLLILGAVILFAAIVAIIIRTQVFARIMGPTADNASRLNQAIKSVK